MRHLEEKYTVQVIAHRWVFQNSQTNKLTKQNRESTRCPYSLKITLLFVCVWKTKRGSWGARDGEEHVWHGCIWRSEDGAVQSALSPAALHESQGSVSGHWACTILPAQFYFLKKQFLWVTTGCPPILDRKNYKLRLQSAGPWEEWGIFKLQTVSGKLLLIVFIMEIAPNTP